MKPDPQETEGGQETRWPIPPANNSWSPLAAQGTAANWCL